MTFHFPIGSGSLLRPDRHRKLRDQPAVPASPIVAGRELALIDLERALALVDDHIVALRLAGIDVERREDLAPACSIAPS